MNSKKETKAKKDDPLNFDEEDSSSSSPEIEDESNNEEGSEQPDDSKEDSKEINKGQSDAYNKLLSIQKRFDTQKYSNNLYNQKKNDSLDNIFNDNDSLEEYNINNKKTIGLKEQDDEYKGITNKNYKMYNNNNIQKDLTIREKGCELFVGNLNTSTERNDLEELFSPYGEITDIRIHKSDDGKKCYAFVRFRTKDMANNALKLDSRVLNNRHIKVTKSNENATIFIGNIRKTWSKNDLEEKIRRIFHNINKIEYFVDPMNPSKNRGFCFGIFNTRSEAIKALNYVNKKGGINIDGISITCDWADVVDDDDNSKSNQIFLSNIKKEVQENDLKNYFSKYFKVISVIMSKNHIKSKRKDLVFITFESHEDAIAAIQKFEEDKMNLTKLKELKRMLFLGDNENIDLIQISLAFSQEAMQNKKKIKDNRKKAPHSGNITGDNNSSSGNSFMNRNNNNNNRNNNNKSFMSINSNNNDYKNNYNTGYRNKNYIKHGQENNLINNNKNIKDLISNLSRNNMQMNRNNQMNNNLLDQLNQLLSNNNSDINKNYNNNNNFNNNNSNPNIINQNINQNQLLSFSNLLNICQQNPNLLQQMNNLGNNYEGDKNKEIKLINRKRGSSNNYNETQNNNYLNFNQTQNQNELISQFPYIPSISQINNPNTSNIPNFQNIIQNTPNFNTFSK